MSEQSKRSKIGEVKYRGEISKQHLGQSSFFENEPTQEQFVQIQKEKLKITKKTFDNLKKKHTLSPYLEIGSEYCFRSALLENNFKSTGFALDISLPSLVAAKKMVPILGYKKIPQRICADAYNLPFKSSSFPFVFIYESLHHFPDPKPVLLEIERVLTPGGICLIGADPVKQSFQIKLWRRPNKLRFWEKLLKLTLILPFISHIGKTEVEYGILEGAFSLKTWQNALTIFDKVDAKIAAYRLGPNQLISKNDQKNWLAPNLLVKFLIFFLGGSMEAVCIKKGKVKSTSNKNVNNLLICPSCLKFKKNEVSLSKKSNNLLICKKCKLEYVKINSILVLFDKKLELALNLQKNRNNQE